MGKAVVQHVTEGNELYWEEAEVPDSKMDKNGVYTGKPLKGNAKGLNNARVIVQDENGG